MMIDLLEQFGLRDAVVEPIARGLINHTLLVRDAAGAPRAVLQRLHPIFGPEVNLDLEAVTAHLAARGVTTPRLIRTTGGEAWVARDDGVWRALTYVAGESYDRVSGPAMAAEAGRLVGRFHCALDGLEYGYRFARAGVHDTAAHLDKLRRLADAGGDPDAEALAREILAEAAQLPPLPETPRRHTHGDLKISNVLFSPDGAALCLIDLDTLGQQTLAYELGDALRSWCNPAGEDVAEPAADRAIFDAALAGYLDAAGDLVTEVERDSLAPGMVTVCIELAARFCADAFEDRYFGWDPARFPDRRTHNLVRARGQLALGRSAATMLLYG
ncbi:MAG TPA: phosphotransferase [Kofleriaceae bacterium]|nr:phosphotransferase [Kofleriaceae bacterium]